MREHLTSCWACRHLDADEATVLGAAKLAANLSTTFRPKTFGMADAAMYPIQLQARTYLACQVTCIEHRAVRQMAQLPEGRAAAASRRLAVASCWCKDHKGSACS